MNQTTYQQTALLSLGSNLGDRAANLLRAISALVNGGLHLTAASAIYETEPVDHLEQPQFLNQVIAVTAPTRAYPSARFSAKSPKHCSRKSPTDRKTIRRCAGLWLSMMTHPAI